MRRSRLPGTGGNLFMLVRAKRDEAASRGVKLLDLSIGEPRGPALLSAREAAAAAIMSEDEAMHAYQYNASPAVPNFSERFVAAHIERNLDGEAGLGYLPIPGIKPVLGLLPLACGCADRRLKVRTMTKPGYPTPADWCDLLNLVDHDPLEINVANEFRFVPSEIGTDTDLVMMNYPHNPSGQVASEPWLRAVCEYCSEHDIRLVNDAAYCVLTYVDGACTLSDVAPDYPDLSWVELFTAAKLIGNGTGWHVGAMVGSDDFIDDMKVVKGKTDTGFVAPMAAGVIAAFEDDLAGIGEFKALYERRLGILGDLMTRQGMRIALRPVSSFYTLWQAPTHAFGRRMENAQAFNLTMIDETGVVGVPFGDYLRYAVCADIEEMADELEAAFKQAAVSYD